MGRMGRMLTEAPRGACQRKTFVVNSISRAGTDGTDEMRPFLQRRVRRSFGPAVGRPARSLQSDVQTKADRGRSWPSKDAKFLNAPLRSVVITIDRAAISRVRLRTG